MIGYGSPRAGTRNAHSDPMPDELVRATKEALGWDPDAQFLVPDEVYAHWREPVRRARRRGCRPSGRRASTRWAAANAELAAEWHDAWAGRPRPGFARGAAGVRRRRDAAISTRKRGGEVMQAFGPFVPTMIGGAADLVHSTFTEFEGDETFTPEHAGRNVAWGVREHGMGAAVNGLALHGGIVKPFGSTFFVFTDYMRPPIRLSALMKLDVVWIFSHDSVAVGEDGPTHQPVEHLAAMRAIPNLTVIRPADANETAEAWGADPRGARRARSASCSRARTCRCSTARVLAPAAGLRRGAYVLADADSPDVVLVATGAEVGDGARRARPARREGRRRRGSSRCRAGSSSRRRAPSTATRCCRRTCRRSRSRPASTFGWARWVDASIGIDTLRRLRARATRCSSTSASAPRPSPSASQADGRRARASRSEGHASASPRPSRSRPRSAS